MWMFPNQLRKSKFLNKLDMIFILAEQNLFSYNVAVECCEKSKDRNSSVN